MPLITPRTVQAAAWAAAQLTKPVADDEARSALALYGEQIHHILHHRAYAPPCRLARLGFDVNASSRTDRNFGVHHVCERSYAPPCLAASYSHNLRLYCE